MYQGNMLGIVQGGWMGCLTLGRGNFRRLFQNEWVECWIHNIAESWAATTGISREHFLLRKSWPGDFNITKLPDPWGKFSTLLHTFYDPPGSPGGQPLGWANNMCIIKFFDPGYEQSFSSGHYLVGSLSFLVPFSIKWNDMTSFGLAYEHIKLPVHVLLSFPIWYPLGHWHS